jgi:hypothetical protein
VPRRCRPLVARQVDISKAPEEVVPLEPNGLRACCVLCALRAAHCVLCTACCALRASLYPLSSSPGLRSRQPPPPPPPSPSDGETSTRTTRYSPPLLLLLLLLPLLLLLLLLLFLLGCANLRHCTERFWAAHLLCAAPRRAPDSGSGPCKGIVSF